MTSSKIELPGEVKTDAAALNASLHSMPSPVSNPEIKYTKVCDFFKKQFWIETVLFYCIFFKSTHNI